MSILARLLNKTEKSDAKGDIPPGVVTAVHNSPRPGSSRRKYLLVGGATVVSVVLGGLLVLYIKLQTPEPPPMQQSASRMPMPENLVQRPVSTSKPAEPAKAEVQKPVKTGSVYRPRPVQTASAVKRSAAREPAPARESEENKAAPVPKDRSVVDSLLFSARNAEARRDYMSAVKHYRQALDADPHNYRIMNNLAGNMLQLGMNHEALAVTSQALAIKPDYVSALVNGAIAQSKLGQKGAAKSMLTRAVALEPGNSSALINLGLILEKEGSIEYARSIWRRLADSGDPQGFLGLGRISEMRGDSGDALRYYRELTALPDSRQRSVKEQARERIRIIEQNY